MSPLAEICLGGTDIALPVHLRGDVHITTLNEGTPDAKDEEVALRDKSKIIDLISAITLLEQHPLRRLVYLRLLPDPHGDIYMNKRKLKSGALLENINPAIIR